MKKALKKNQIHKLFLYNILASDTSVETVNGNLKNLSLSIEENIKIPKHLVKKL